MHRQTHPTRGAGVAGICVGGGDYAGPARQRVSRPRGSTAASPVWCPHHRRIGAAARIPANPVVFENCTFDEPVTMRDSEITVLEFRSCTLPAGRPRRADGAAPAMTGLEQVVRAGDDLYVRSAYGPDDSWYRRARAASDGRVQAGSVERDVTVADAADPRRHRLGVPRQVRPLRSRERRLGRRCDGRLNSTAADHSTLEIALLDSLGFPVNHRRRSPRTSPVPPSNSAPAPTHRAC
jgi:hypothetical protein